MIKLCVVCCTRTVTANYSCFHLELPAGCYCIFSPNTFFEPFRRTEQIQLDIYKMFHQSKEHRFCKTLKTLDKDPLLC